MRLALPYKGFALLTILMSFSLWGAQKDRFLFRVADQVVSLQDLKLTDEDFSALQCHLDDSLILEYLGSGFRKKLHENVLLLEKLEGPLGAHRPLVIFLASMRQVWKLLNYVDAQEVAITPELEKSILAPSKCPSVTGTDKKMIASFKRWLRVEIYLRSRYAQNGMDQRPERKEKRFQSINLFIDSLDKQIVHEDFW